MLTRRTLLRSSLVAAGAASLDLGALAGPVARSASSKWIELDRNENPYGPSQAARKAMIDRIERGNRYLDGDELNAFRDQIAKREGVTREHIVLGAGSSEILWMAAREYLREGGTLVQGHPTFELIGRLAAQHGADIRRIAVTKAQQDDLDALGDACAKKASLLYLNWPNNPCGSMIGGAAMRDFVAAMAERLPVFVDEAYLDYADPALQESTVSLVREGADVIVARTFSKIHGLAGMRMGYAIAQPETARRLSAYRFSVLNSLAVAAASAALDDRPFQDLSRKRNGEAKKLVYRTFEEAGITCVPSSTSFVWFREEGRGIASKLRERGILIPNGRFEGGWNRVTIGTLPEMERWAEVVRTL